MVYMDTAVPPPGHASFFFFYDTVFHAALSRPSAPPTRALLRVLLFYPDIQTSIFSHLRMCVCMCV